MTDSLADLQQAIDAFVDERDWAQFHAPKNLAMGVAIEAAEIMEHFLWCSTEASFTLDPKKRAEVANEIGDVLIYLMGLARALDVDIVAAARDKLALNREKYPVDKAKGRATKYVDFD
ncbi:MAG: nucleotide pyrophosphohydrolase [Betaproteobacteria bacterium]